MSGGLGAFSVGGNFEIKKGPPPLRRMVTGDVQFNGLNWGCVYRLEGVLKGRLCGGFQ